jgi:hypothetical protein
MKYQVRCCNLFKGMDKRDFYSNNFLILSNNRQELTFWDLTLLEFGSELQDTEHEIRKCYYFRYFLPNQQIFSQVRKSKFKGKFIFAVFEPGSLREGLIPVRTVRRLLPVTARLSKNRYFE